MGMVLFTTSAVDSAPMTALIFDSIQLDGQLLVNKTFPSSHSNFQVPEDQLESKPKRFRVRLILQWKWMLTTIQLHVFHVYQTLMFLHGRKHFRVIIPSIMSRWTVTSMNIRVMRETSMGRK